ncbi:hypothetical protein E4U82_11335 [Lentibacillus salicampi]|uniref:Uncharacterized protein n=1 Tax=Lentibacillus salicampi TaxID=175306 RepID=A0A4Y9AE20_9BACI|nr:hypothetical protein E4U82_11335 [Lentibacillus salicampi]
MTWISAFLQLYGCIWAGIQVILWKEEPGNERTGKKIERVEGEIERAKHPIDRPNHQNARAAPTFE